MGNDADDIAKAITSAVAQATHELSSADLLEIGHAAQTVILLRTKRGLDADRKAFVPYTAEYAARRAKIGRSTRVVDLAITGHMQQAFGPHVSGKDEVALRFSSEIENTKANAHNDGTRRLPKREWFDVRADDDVKFVEDVVGKIIDGRVEKIR